MFWYLYKLWNDHHSQVNIFIISLVFPPFLLVLFFLPSFHVPFLPFFTSDLPLSKFQIYEIVLLTMITMLYIRSSEQELNLDHLYIPSALAQCQTYCRCLINTNWIDKWLCNATVLVCYSLIILYVYILFSQLGYKFLQTRAYNKVMLRMILGNFTF